MTDIQNDPFAAVAADAESVEDLGFGAAEAPAPKKAPAKKKPAATEGDGKVTVTLKGGSGFDAPWIVIHAADIPDAYEQFCEDNAALLVELMNKVKKAGQFFSGGDSKPAARPAPAQAQSAPAGAPECPPGWTYKSGVNKNTGKPWQGFFPPRGDDTKPIFFN